MAASTSSSSCQSENENENAFHGIAPGSRSEGSDYPSYDVFINHRGPDVKASLATLIYQHLSVFNVRVFLDQKELRTGDFLPLAIQHAITTCNVHVAIFSKNYAQSPWCLAELSFMRKTGSKIIPVYYDVQPSDVRYVYSGLYAQAFRKHEEKKRIDSQTLEKWKNDLHVVSFISGIVFNTANDDEAMLLKRIVESVVQEVKGEVLDVAKNPVGLDEAVDQLEKAMMEAGQQSAGNVRIAGIVGMGASGKTTLAKQFYNNMSWAYKALVASCLIKSEGKEILRKQLLGRKVLIVLDDINHVDQIDALLVSDVLGSDSLIIITSRDKGVLTNSGISAIYELKGLQQTHAQELFCWHAFLLPCPMKGFEDLVEKFSNKCSGLPLSLKVIGSLLYGHRDLIFWNGKLQKISKVLPSDIKNTLTVSYDALDMEKKQMFLDIACFFVGEEKNMVLRIWEGSDWNAYDSLQTLKQRCLVEFSRENEGYATEGEDNILIKMHDQLADLGKNIVDDLSHNHPSLSRRLWRTGDVMDLLQRRTRTNMEVRGICSDGTPTVPEPERLHRSTWLYECWTDLLQICNRLGFLTCSMQDNISGLKLLSAEGDSIITKFSSLSKDLLWLRWCDCPYNSIPPHISMKNLRVLELISKFDFQTLWHSYGQAPTQLRELRFWGNHSCATLKIPKSIGELKQLEKIILNGGKMRTLPEEICFLKCSSYLDLKELPQELGELSNLRDLRVGSRLLRALPLSLGNLCCLKSLVLLNCSMLNSLPDSIGQLKCLEELKIYDSGVEYLPEGVAYLNNLRYLTVLRCPLGDVTFARVGVEEEISDCRNPLMSKCMFGLKSITLESTKTSKICISKDACPNLEALEATYCQSLNHVEGLPITLVNLNLSGCDGLKKISGLSNLAKLRYLNISGCLELEELEDLVQLTLLKYFIADGCSMLKKVGSLQQLKQLKEMQITAEQNAIWKDIQFLKDLPFTVSSITMNARTIGGDEREVYSILTSFSFSLTVLDFSPDGLCKVEIAEAKSCSAVIVVFICKSSTERHDPIKDLLKLGSNYCMQEYFVNVNIECECEWIIMSLFTKDTMFLQEFKRVKIEDNMGVYANLPNNSERKKGWMVVVGDGEEWKIAKAWGKLFTYIQAKQLGDHLQS
eukprot:Gb_16703 [translate_table: standard]